MEILEKEIAGFQKSLRENTGGLALVIARKWQEDAHSLEGHVLDEKIFIGKISPKGFELKKGSLYGVLDELIFYLNPVVEKGHRLSDKKWEKSKCPMKLLAGDYPIGKPAIKSWEDEYGHRVYTHTTRKNSGCFPSMPSIPPLTYKIIGDLPAIELFSSQEAIESFVLDKNNARDLSPLDYLAVLKFLPDFLPQKKEFQRCLLDEALKLIQRVCELEHEIGLKSKTILRKAELATSGEGWISDGAINVCDDPVIATWRDREEHGEIRGHIKRIIRDATMLDLQNSDFILALPNIPGSTVHIGSFFKKMISAYKVTKE